MEATFPRPRRSPVEINPEPPSECSISLLFSFLQQLHASTLTHGVAFQLSGFLFLSICCQTEALTVHVVAKGACLGTQRVHLATKETRLPPEDPFPVPRLGARWLNAD